METRQMAPFFSSTFSDLTVCNIHFWNWKYSKFIFIWVDPLVHSGLKSRHLEVTKNLYYVFSPTCWSQLPIYLGSSSSWTICLSTLHNFSSAPFPTNLSLLNVKHLDVILSTYLWLLPPMLVVYSASLMGNLDCIQIPTDWAYTHRSFIKSF